MARPFISTTDRYTLVGLEPDQKVKVSYMVWMDHDGDEESFVSILDQEWLMMMPVKKAGASALYGAAMGVLALAMTAF